MSSGESFVKVQRNLIRKNFALSEVDRLKVLDLIDNAGRRGATRVVLLAIVKFEDGEVRIVSDMDDFVHSFDRVRFDGDYQESVGDDFSIAMLGEHGEDAYKQYKSITSFLTKTHQGWFLTVREAVATYKKPRNFWKLLANIGESYDKKFTEYRLIVDTGKTADIRLQPLIAHERTMLFGATTPPAREKSQASETMASVSSSLFSRGSNSLLKRIEPKSTEWSKKPPEDQQTNANSGTESEGGDDDTLGTMSKEYHKELEKEAKLRRQLSSSSLSSSSKSLTKKLKMKSRKH